MLELLRHPTPELLCTLEGAELCTHLGVEEQLRRPTPELTHALGELMFTLGDAGATVASPYRSSRACLMMELLFTLNADNRQIFLWIGLEIGLVSRGSFR